MNLLSGITFFHPWILGGLAALPALWYLLRIMPPAPRLILLPTARFLKGLVPEQQTPSHTPWWILLLRMFIAALVLLALAGPVYSPGDTLPSSRTLRIIMDNSWAAAQTWDQQIRAATDILAEARREKKEIYLLTTAPTPGEKSPLAQGPLSGAQAESIIKGLKPLPWPADYQSMQKTIKEQAPAFWFAHGLDEGGFAEIAAALQAKGGLSYYQPAPGQLPLALGKPEKQESGKLRIAVNAPASITPGHPVAVQALAEDGRLIDEKNIALKPTELPAVVDFDTPDKLHSEISHYRIAGNTGSGGFYILGNSNKKKSVGLPAPSEKTDPKPFVEARFYIERAAEPFVHLIEGNIEDILRQNPSIIVLPDVAALPAQVLDALEKWTKEGGLLLRFAGANIAASRSAIPLTPVPLRSGGRALDGSVTWEKPLKIQPFPATSPLSGLALHEDIIVRRQILAEPSPDLEEKTWAKLEDGTPLITASPHGKGLLVMVHTSAAPDWSDLPLSGAYVEILRRVFLLAGAPKNISPSGEGRFEPLWILDGNGLIQKPDSTVQSIAAQDLENITVDSQHPPGLYARNGFQFALNLGDQLKTLKGVEALPGMTMKTYGKTYELNFMPYILSAALLLLLLDWLVMIIIASVPALRFAGLALLLLALPAQAAPTAQDMQYADGLYLAYIKTGDELTDSMSKQGLENLSTVLQRRSSAEPDGVAALDPETDSLVFFPLIYWAISPLQPDLSEQALVNIQSYLDHGGTILFDLRDHSDLSAGFLNTRSNSAHLSRLIGRLNVPSLAPVPNGHVMLRSFYLLENFQQRFPDGSLWVETQSGSGRDGVSSVIISSHDWAGQWAGSGGSSFSGGSREQEMAFRFGVNLMMYALTGNYKADQVHVPYILERLGQ